MQRAERSRQQREEARNSLESYLYRLRDLLDGNEEAPFIIFSKESERTKMTDLLQSTSVWLNENGETADLLDLWSKREAIEWVILQILPFLGKNLTFPLIRALEKPIQQRHRESETLLPAISDIEQALRAGQLFLESARLNYTIEETSGTLHKYTAEEIDEVETRINSTALWLQEKSAVQKALRFNEDPVLVISRGKALQNHVMRLLRRQAPRPKTTSTETVSSTTTSATTTTTTAAETEDVEGGSTHGHDEL